MTDELPQGWAEITLQRAGAWRSGGTPSRRRPEFFGKGVRWVKSGDLPDGPILTTEEEITKLGLENSAAKLMPTGTISMALYGATIGKLGVMMFPAATNQACANVVPDRHIVELKYLFYYLRSERRKFIEQGQGGAQPNISQEIVRAHPFRLAPLVEQRRIVAKLDTISDRLYGCQQRLAKIPALLKRFRQSVLAAACSGRLTADWRQNDSYEDDLPMGWRWMRLEQLLPERGIFDGPFGSNLKSSDYTTSGVRVIRLENIGQLRFVGEKKTFVNSTKYEALKKHEVREGDIIFASFISEEVRACVLPELSTKAIAKADCFCLRPNPELVDRKYLAFQLVSQESYNVLFEEIHGATRPRINTTQLRKLDVRVCPLPEQQEIVRRVDCLFALADRLELRFAEGLKQVGSITDALLAKAFRGELVPTESELAKVEGRSFEAAEELLERISHDGKFLTATKKSSSKVKTADVITRKVMRLK